MSVQFLTRVVELPPLREELTLHAGPTAADGSPTWNLQDPARNRFFRIDWPTFQILSHWQLKDPKKICDAIAAESPLELVPEDVETVLKFLAQSELLQTFSAQGSARLLTTEQRLRQSPLSWLLHHYLFFRIPLLQPDAWLERMTPYVQLFYSRAFLNATLLALVFGLIETFRQWPHFAATFVDTLSWEGLAGYAGVLAAVKVLHELGHAFTAKRFGCRVPTMGLAFLVMWPVAYTDVNDTWKLHDRRQRLAVSAAGVLTELAIAAWATLAWALLPEGALRGCAFVLAAVTWISTLTVNASPFMRFDGYFLMSDWLDIPNLHSRAFALARWRLREWLFALGEDKPEIFTRGRERFLIAFAWLTWLYRISLFLGIAVLVYRHFFKALGLALFTVEIGWFVLLPLAQELREWLRRRDAIVASPRVRVSAAAALLILALGFAPLDLHLTAQGILRPAHVAQIYAPDAATVVLPPKAIGEKLRQGDSIVELVSAELSHREALAIAQRATLQAQLDADAIDAQNQQNLPVLREQLATTTSELAGIERERSRFLARAPFDGVLVDPLPDLRPGDPVPRNAMLATLVDPAVWEVKTYLDEGQTLRVSVGDTARFYPEAPGSAPVDLVVTRIDRDATRELPELMIGSTHGGQIPVHASREALVPDRAIYAITLRATTSTEIASLHAVRGRTVINGKAKPVLGEYFRTAVAVVIRESGW